MEEDEAPGVPEWVVTYGDMMSLLLTFFIMLVSLSEVVADQKYRAILDSLQQYSGYRGAPEAPAGTNYPLNGMIETLKTNLGSHTDDDDGYGGVRKKSIEGNSARMFRTREGKSLRAGKPIYFELHTLKLLPDAEEKIKALAQQLAGKPNKIEIRGYVSLAELPKNSRWKNKTELSYHRARLVWQKLIALKVDENRLRIGAAGDREASTANNAKTLQNRDRVEVLILDTFANDFIGPRSDTN